MKTGFCNPLNDEASHKRCPIRLDSLPVEGPCTCGCHSRFAIIWLDWMGEPHVEDGWKDRGDAEHALRLMREQSFIPEDAEIDLVPYLDGEEWVGM